MAFLRIKSIQTGVATLLATGNYTSASISAVDLSKSFLTCSFRQQSAYPDDTLLQPRFVNSTTIGFHISGSADYDMTIRWQCIEFESGASVQHLDVAPVQNGTTTSISSVDTSKTYCQFMLRDLGSTLYGDDSCFVDITSSTQVTYRVGSANQIDVVFTHVIQIDDASVQKVSSINQYDQDFNVSISAITLAKSFAYLGMKIDSGTFYINQFATLEFDSTTELRIVNENYSENVDVDYYAYVVSLPSYVWATSWAYFVISSGNSQATNSKSAYPLDRSWYIKGSWLNSHSRINNTTQEFGNTMTASYLSSTTQVTHQRQLTPAISVIGTGWRIQGWITQDITPTGITSAQAFGNPQIGIEQYPAPNSIPSGEAFGSPILSMQIRPSSISSLESFGSPALSMAISPSSIASSESFGSPAIGMSLTVLGISSGEAFGEPTIVPGNVDVAPESILSTETFGEPNIILFIQGVGGIVSAEAFGEPIISRGNVNVNPNSIESSEAFGEPTIVSGGISISPNSIASAESFGSPTLNLQIYISSILSAENFGALIIQPPIANITPQSIASSETFGEPEIVPGTIVVTPSGIISGEQFGNLIVLRGTVYIDANSISSSETWGSPSVVPMTTYVIPNGIASGQAFGQPSLSTGNVNVSPVGIDGAEAFGVPLLTVSGVQVSPESITSGEGFGFPSLVPGMVVLFPASISSGESVGIPSIVPGGVAVSPEGIPSQESFGSVNLGIAIVTESIVSGETFGHPTITVGNVNIVPVGISSEEVFGSVIVRHVLLVNLSGAGITSEEIFGVPKVNLRILNTFMQIMETDLQEGFFNQEEFAQSGTYIYSNGETFELPIIYDNEMLTVDPDTGAEILSRQPMIQAQTSDFIHAPDKGDKIIINGVRYQIIDHVPDGTGVSIFRLHHERTV